MKVLIVHAHENSNSFCSALAQTANQVLVDQGFEVIVSDLYAMGFNPVGSKKDFLSLSERGYYKYAMEQFHSSKEGTFALEVQKEIDKLDGLDLLIFNFPMWWYSMPAILKGWVDRILAYGVAYGGDYGMGPNGRFKGARAMATITTGSPEELLPPVDKILSNINDGIFRLIGFEVIEPFIAYGVSKKNLAERKEIIEQFILKLRAL